MIMIIMMIITNDEDIGNYNDCKLKLWIYNTDDVKMMMIVIYDVDRDDGDGVKMMLIMLLVII